MSRIETSLKMLEYANALMKANADSELLNKSLEELIVKKKLLRVNKNNQMKKILHILSHDLLNPFSKLKVSLKLLDSNSDKLNELKRLLDQSADNKIGIIEMVRKMRFLEDRELKTNIKRHTLKDLVEETQSIMSDYLKKENIHLINCVEENLSVLVEKTSFINSVLNVIISNTINVSFPGSKIEIYGYEEENYTTAVIKDFGIGIHKTMMDDVFNPGQSTHSKRLDKDIGTCLAIPLARRCVKAYGGSITVESKDKIADTISFGTEIKLKLRNE